MGRARFAKICAVEGIDLTEAVARELEQFDDAGLSPEQRRNAIKDKFGRPND